LHPAGIASSRNCRISCKIIRSARVKKVSDNRTIGPREFLSSQKIFLRKKKAIVKILDRRRSSEEKF
jgi:hypothetical protein